MSATPAQRANLNKVMNLQVPKMTGVDHSVWNWLNSRRYVSDSYHLKKIDRDLATEFRKVLKELDLLEEE